MRSHIAPGPNALAGSELLPTVLPTESQQSVQITAPPTESYQQSVQAIPDISMVVMPAINDPLNEVRNQVSNIDAKLTAMLETIQQQSKVAALPNDAPAVTDLRVSIVLGCWTAI